jgi:hypothetical protein
MRTQDWMALVVSLLTLIIVIIMTFLYYQKFEKDSPSWVCITQRCEQYQTQEDWKLANCRADEKIGALVCRVELNGIVLDMKMDEIDWSKVRLDCKTKVCDAEVLVRKLHNGGELT